MRFIGIDPGINGAIALTDGKSLRVYDIAGSLNDAIGILQRISKGGNVVAVIESVNNMPGDGGTSAFNFGYTYGHLRGACIALGIPIIAEPRPTVWKQAVGLILDPPKLIKAGKKATDAERKAHEPKKRKYKAEQKIQARDRIRQLFPAHAQLFALVKDADRAEAALMAWYGRLTYIEG